MAIDRIHAVLILPAGGITEPPNLVEGLCRTGWQNGPWPDHGGAEVAELLRAEVPTALKPTLARQVAAFYSAPLQIQDTVQLLGLEFLAASEDAPALLAFHLIANRSQSSVRNLNSLCRAWTESSCQMRQLVLSADPLGDPKQLVRDVRGLAIAVTAEPLTDIDSNSHDSTFLYSDAGVRNPSLLIRGRLTHVAIVVALQHYGLREVVAEWPEQLSDARGFARCSAALYALRHRFNWDLLHRDHVSQAVYIDLRERLGITTTFAQLGAELNEYAEIRRTRFERRLGLYGSAFAFSSLITGFAPVINELVPTALAIATCVGATCASVAAAFVLDHRR